MATLWADGFEDWTSATGEYETVGGTPTTVAGEGRRGSTALYLDGNSDAIKRSISQRSEIFFSFSIRPTSLASPSLVYLDSGVTRQITITVGTDGSLSARRGAANSANILGTSAAGVLSVGVASHFQGRVVFSDTVGIVQIRPNGGTTPILDLSAVDTNNGAAFVGCDGVGLGGTNSSGQFSTVGYYDDLHIWDTLGDSPTTWTGDTRVDPRRPAGNGDSSQFVGSDGNSTDNYLLVDGSAPNTTDYVQSDVVGNKDLYQFDNMTHTPTEIFSVVVTASALKDDAGTREVRLLAKSGGTEAEGSTHTLSTSRQRYTSVFANDPATSAAWTKAGVDAAQFGVKVQS